MDSGYHPILVYLRMCFLFLPDFLLKRKPSSDVRNLERLCDLVSSFVEVIRFPHSCNLSSC